MESAPASFARTTLRGHLRIRPAEAGGHARIAEISNTGIGERVATFGTALRTVEDIMSWGEDGQPFIVAIDNDRVIGWASAGAYSGRCVHQGVGEHAVYVHPDASGRGLGRPAYPAVGRRRTPRAVQAHQPRVHRE